MGPAHRASEETSPAGIRRSQPGCLAGIGERPAAAGQGRGGTAATRISSCFWLARVQPAAAHASFANPFGLPKLLLRDGGTLSAPSALEPEDNARNFLRANALIFPLSSLGSEWSACPGERRYATGDPPLLQSDARRHRRIRRADQVHFEQIRRSGADGGSGRSPATHPIHDTATARRRRRGDSLPGRRRQGARYVVTGLFQWQARLRESARRRLLAGHRRTDDSSDGCDLGAPGISHLARGGFRHLVRDSD